MNRYSFLRNVVYSRMNIRHVEKIMPYFDFIIPNPIISKKEYLLIKVEIIESVYKKAKEELMVEKNKQFLKAAA